MPSKAIMCKIVVIMLIDNEASPDEIDALTRETLKRIADKITIEYCRVPDPNLRVTPN